MPVITPPLEGNTLKMLERLRSLLDADTDLHTVGGDLYEGAVREFPPDAVEQGDGVVVAIHAGAEDFNPETLGQPTGRMKVAPICILSVLVYEGEGGDAAATYNRLLSVTSAVRWALWKYRRDPTSGDCMWHSLVFKQRPTTTYNRLPDAFQDSRTVFELRQQSKANC